MYDVVLFAAWSALILAIISLVAMRRLATSSPTIAKLRLLSTEISDISIRCDSLETQLRRLRSKYAMRDRREADKQPAEPEIDPRSPEWKTQFRAELAKAGRLNAKFHTG